jgi:hypothetical protein
MLLKPNDDLIEEFIKSSNYIIKKDGSIFSHISQYGHYFDIPRPVGSVKDGFLVVRYKNKALFVHRIIWAKFRGDLNQELNITHLDGNKLNNNADNLDLVTQSDSNYARFDVYGNDAVIGHSKDSERLRAIALRKKGMSVKDIAKELMVAKSSVSVWVRDIQLTEKQREVLSQKISDNALMINSNRSFVRNQYGVVDLKTGLYVPEKKQIQEMK